jgi:2-polyprenyl-6-methoxyphenol hydroxylase-like FAD-dependent oxidoreductase
MMAAQLLRQGLHPVIIDSKTSPTNQSRALAIQARSLEIFRQLGIVDSLLKEGNIAKGLILHRGTEETSKLDLSTLSGEKSSFPYVLILEQNKTERILLDYLTTNACPVFWNTELLEIQQTDEQVTLKINRNNEEKIITSDWLVGADGAGSKVRKALNIHFTGGTYEHKFYLADLAIGQELGNDFIRIFVKDEGFAGIFPMQNGIYRFIGVLPETLKNRQNLLFEDIKPYLTFTLDFALQEEQCNWFATYQLHHRMAERFRSQRCFLIGDAAHIHSPVGGQGMNTGLQDAYNLAWKLAGVIKKELPVKILDTYVKERTPVAKKLLQTTDRLFTIAVAQGFLIRKLRSWIIPIFIKRVWKHQRTTSQIFSLVSQTGINYRESSLAVHHSHAKKVKAGDRLPYIKFYNEKRKTETDLHCWCNKSGFTLIILGKFTTRDLLALAKWIRVSYPFNLNFYYLPPSERNQHVFDSFEIKKNGKKALIVRPDMHIGYMNDIVDIELLDGYLKQITTA